jgi:hypothetical protein
MMRPCAPVAAQDPNLEIVAGLMARIDTSARLFEVLGFVGDNDAELR